MKKIIIVFLALVLIITGSYIVLNQKKALLRGVDIAQVVPEGPLFYIRVSHIKKNVDDFTSTKFWQDLRKISIKRIIQEMNYGEERIAVYDAFKTKTLDEANNLLSSKLFGQKIGLALYPANINFDQLDPKATQELMRSIVLVVQLTPQAQAAQFINAVFTRFAESSPMQEIKYKNHVITQIKSETEGLTIYYAKIKDFLVISLNDKMIQNCIDVTTKTKKSLEEDADYKKTSERFLKSADVVAYGHYQKFVSGIKDQIVKLAALKSPTHASQKSIEDAFSQFNGFTTVGYSYTPGSAKSAATHISAQNFMMFYEQDKLEPYIRQLYSCQPVENKAIKFIPQNAAIYQWNNCFNFEDYWKKMKEEFAKQPQGENAMTPEMVITKIQDALKLNLETDILPALGNEYGGYFSDINLEGLFPIPQILFFIKIDDRAKAEHMMTTLVNQPIINLQTEDYKGTGIKYFSFPLAANLQPGYCFLDEYLLIALNRDLLKSSIDALGDPTKSLTANQNFKEINLGLTEKSNGVFFLEMTELARQMDKFVQWGEQWLTMRISQQKAFLEGSKKRLEDLKGEIQQKEKELANLNSHVETLTKAAPTVPKTNGPSQSAFSATPVGDTTAPTSNAAAAAPEQNPPVQQNSTLTSAAFPVDPAQIENLRNQIKEKEMNLNSAKERQKELEQYIDQSVSARPPIDEKQKEFLVNEVINPLLKALGSIHAMGSKMIITSDHIETISYTNVE